MIPDSASHESSPRRKALASHELIPQKMRESSPLGGLMSTALGETWPRMVTLDELFHFKWADRVGAGSQEELQGFVVGGM